MIEKGEALDLIRKNVKNENIVKHMLALDAVMGELHAKLSIRKKDIHDNKMGGTLEEYKIAGLLHDGDYCEAIPVEMQGIQITEWARDLGYEIPDNVAYAMAAHNWRNTGCKPKTLMDWCLFCADSMTGLIVACALVMPSRKLSDVSLEMVIKKFKQPSFAKGTRRDDILLCEEKIGLKLEEMVTISLKAMQDISLDLGL